MTASRPPLRLRVVSVASDPLADLLVAPLHLGVIPVDVLAGEMHVSRRDRQRQPSRWCRERRGSPPGCAPARQLVGDDRRQHAGRGAPCKRPVGADNSALLYRGGCPYRRPLLSLAGPANPPTCQRRTSTPATKPDRARKASAYEAANAGSNSTRKLRSDGGRLPPSNALVGYWCANATTPSELVGPGAGPRSLSPAPAGSMSHFRQIATPIIPGARGLPRAALRRFPTAPVWGLRRCTARGR